MNTGSLAGRTAIVTHEGLMEIAWLEDLAAACAADEQWSFLYAAAPRSSGSLAR